MADGRNNAGEYAAKPKHIAVGRDIRDTDLIGNPSEVAEHIHRHKVTETKAILNRMSRIIGHMEAVRKMVSDGRDCSEILIQLSAVDSAVHGVSRVILKDHLAHCIVEAAVTGDTKDIEKVNRAVDQILKK